MKTYYKIISGTTIATAVFIALTAFISCASQYAGINKNKQLPADFKPMTDEQKSDCSNRAEELLWTLIGDDRFLPPGDDYWKKESDWTDDCATSPHSSVFFAYSLYVRGKTDRARGMTYEALAKLDAAKNEAFAARAITAYLAMELGLSRTTAAKEAEKSCKGKIPIACGVAAAVYYDAGWAPAKLKTLLAFAKGGPAYKIKDLILKAHLTRGEGAQAYEFLSKEGAHNEAEKHMEVYAYLRARGVPKDAGEREALKSSAAEACKKGACYACASASALSEGGFDSLSGQLACACKAAQSCEILADRYESEKKDSEVYNLREEACSQGCSDSCWKAYKTLLNGGEAARALPFLVRACAFGSEEGCREIMKTEARNRNLDVVTGACEKGKIGAACALAAQFFVSKEESELGFSYAEKGCALRDGASCAISAKGWIERKEKDKARDKSKLACELKSGAGCALYADMCEKSGEDKNKLIISACEYGDGASCKTLALKIGQRNSEWSSLMRSACKYGVNDACGADGLEIDRETAKNGCESGAPTACYYYARFLLSAANQSDASLAIEYAKAACLSGEFQACSLVYSIYSDMGQPDLGNKYLADCCDGGGKECCVVYGCRAMQKDNLSKAASLLDKHCRDGSEKACSCLGEAYFKMDKCKDAQKPLGVACALGSQKSCLYYALCKAADSPGEAYESLKKFCDEKDASPRACFEAGKIAGQKGDYESELKFMSRSCENYDAETCSIAAEAAQKIGKKSEAESLYKKGCRKGKSSACMSAAKITPSLDLYERACELSNADGCFSAAEIYLKKGDKEAYSTYLDFGCSIAPAKCPANNKEKK